MLENVLLKKKIEELFFHNEFIKKILSQILIRFSEIYLEISFFYKDLTKIISSHKP